MSCPTRLLVGARVAIQWPHSAAGRVGTVIHIDDHAPADATVELEDVADQPSCCAAVSVSSRQLTVLCQGLGEVAPWRAPTPVRATPVASSSVVPMPSPRPATTPATHFRPVRRKRSRDLAELADEDDDEEEELRQLLVRPRPRYVVEAQPLKPSSSSSEDKDLGGAAALLDLQTGQSHVHQWQQPSILGMPGVGAAPTLENEEGGNGRNTPPPDGDTADEESVYESANEESHENGNGHASSGSSSASGEVERVADIA